MFEMESKTKPKQQMVEKTIITVKTTWKFNSDNNLPLNKSLKFHAITITIRPLFEEGGKLYPQFYLGECLYELRA